MSRIAAYLDDSPVLAAIPVLDRTGRLSPARPVLATPVTIVAFGAGVAAGSAIVAAFEAGRTAGTSTEPIIT
ncbi:hypothetical protein ACFV0Z_02290 [Streptomyces xiamenensis]|uniref:hypothetical protein n=1 Tax=Streptomyces xiamenensis TaxID=408015 RepID=UPI00342FB52B